MQKIRGSILISGVLLAGMCSCAAQEDHDAIVERIKQLGGDASTYDRLYLEKHGLPGHLRGKIASVQLEFLDLSNADLSQLIPPKSTRYLNLKGSVVKNEQLRFLADSEMLDLLILDATDVTDDLLRDLAGIPTLRELSLAFCPITDDGLDLIATSTSLQDLKVMDTHVTHQGISALRERCPNIVGCYWSTVPSDEVLDALAGLTRHDVSILASLDDSLQLVVLDPDYSKETYSVSLDTLPPGKEHEVVRLINIVACEAPTSVGLFGGPHEWIKECAALRNVEKLAFGGNRALERGKVGARPWQDKDFDWLAELPLVRSVTLSRVQAIGASAIARCRGLEELSLERVTLSAGTLATFAESKTLRSLRIAGVDMEEVSLGELSACPSLKELSLTTGGKNIDVDGLKTLEQLQSITFSTPPAEEDGGLAFCQALPNLRELNLPNAWKGTIAPLKRCPSLRSLSVCVTYVRDVETLRELSWLTELRICSHNPLDFESILPTGALQTLLLSDCPLDSAGLKYISSIKTLKELGFSDCKGVDEAAVESLQTKRPGLKLRFWKGGIEKVGGPEGPKLRRDGSTSAAR